MSDKNSDIEVIGPEDLEEGSEESSAPQETGAEKSPEGDTAKETAETDESNAAPAISKPEEEDDPPLEDLAAPVLAPPAAQAPDLGDLVGPVRPVVTAARPTATLQEVSDDEEEDDDDLDETIAERLLGLTEMFPDFVRTGSVRLVKGSVGFTKSCYSLSRTVSWVVFSSAALLFMPIMIETERLQLQDQQKAQKTQMLLGPGNECNVALLSFFNVIIFQEQQAVEDPPLDHLLFSSIPLILSNSQAVI